MRPENGRVADSKRLALKFGGAGFLLLCEKRRERDYAAMHEQPPALRGLILRKTRVGSVARSHQYVCNPLQQ